MANHRFRGPALRGGNPRNVKLCTAKPESTNAVINAVGPGMAVISISATSDSRTKVNPGSLTEGVPASETRAI